MLDEVKSILIDTLKLPYKPNEMDEDSQLLGSIPEFDSMAVVALITALEENYGFEVDDDEIDGEVFETLGSLCEFVQQKVDS